MIFYLDVEARIGEAEEEGRAKSFAKVTPFNNVGGLRTTEPANFPKAQWH